MIFFLSTAAMSLTTYHSKYCPNLTVSKPINLHHFRSHALKIFLKRESLVVQEIYSSPESAHTILSSVIDRVQSDEGTWNDMFQFEVPICSNKRQGRPQALTPAPLSGNAGGAPERGTSPQLLTPVLTHCHPHHLKFPSGDDSANKCKTFH